jgi:hypothetical protein
LRTPLTLPGQKIKLGQLNLIIGGNDTGKSAICEWISAFGNLEKLVRWRRDQVSQYPTQLQLNYFDPDEHSAYLQVGHDGSVLFQLDGQNVPISPIPMRIVFPRDRRGFNAESLNDLELLAKIFDLDQALCRNLLDHVNVDADSTVRNAKFIEEDGRLTLHADVEGTCPGLPFGILSSSEQERVVMEMAIALSRVLGAHSATLLVLDPGMSYLDISWFERYSQRLSSPRNPFQTLAVIPTRKLDLTTLRWLGWEIIRTTNRRPVISIDQSSL